MPASYQFRPTMSGQNSGSQQSRSYDFGDGNTKQTNGSMAEHSYSQPGTYNAVMTMNSANKSSDTVTCNTSVVVQDQTPVAPAATVQETPPAQQEAQPEVTSSKLPDTGPGEIAAFGFVWTFMGSLLFAYRGRMDSIIATIVSRLG